MTDIFLSYAEQDRARARQLAEALGAIGWDVWWDRRIPAGTRWPEVLEAQLKSMRCMVVATRTIGARLAAFVASRHPKSEVRRFSNASLKTEPLVLLGTFTGVNAEGKPTGAREAYRVWLTLIDLSTRKVVGKATTHAQVEGVDATPTTAFRDAPAWTADPATAAYLDACQKSRLGEPAPTGYLERIRTAASIAQAIEEYEASQYRQSLATFVRVLLAPEGNQLRVHTGVYLNHWKLKDGEQTRAAFARVVDFGLEHGVLAVKFEFRPGSAALRDASKGVAAQYPMWLNTIATRAARSGQCLDLTGHSSPTGPEPLNQRLSVRRAEFVATRLASEAPALRQRMVAGGAGSSATMIGNGRDDDSDALDRRVELRLLDCSFRTGG